MSELRCDSSGDRPLPPPALLFPRVCKVLCCNRLHCNAPQTLRYEGSPPKTGRILRASKTPPPFPLFLGWSLFSPAASDSLIAHFAFHVNPALSFCRQRCCQGTERCTFLTFRKTVSGVRIREKNCALKRGGHTFCVGVLVSRMYEFRGL